MLLSFPTSNLPPPPLPTHTHTFPCSVEIVSEAFQGQSLVARHRQVYGIVKEELDAGLHALSLKLKTPQEVAR